MSDSRSCLIRTTSPRLCRLYICPHKAPAGEIEQMGVCLPPRRGIGRCSQGLGRGAGNTNLAKKSRLTPLVTCYLAHTLLISFSSAVSYLKKGTGISRQEKSRESKHGRTRTRRLISLCCCSHWSSPLQTGSAGTGLPQHPV